MVSGHQTPVISIELRDGTGLVRTCRVADKSLSKWRDPEKAAVTIEVTFPAFLGVMEPHQSGLHMPEQRDAASL